MPKLNANGLNFHYQQAGAGPDVFLIHGVTGDLSIWFLCEAMGVLGRSFRVTAYDLRGHGYSDVSARRYTSADQAADLMAIMDALEIDRAMLVGHSFGAVIAMHAAVSHPGSDRRGRPVRPILPGAAAPGRREPLGPLAELPRGSAAGRRHAFG